MSGKMQTDGFEVKAVPTEEEAQKQIEAGITKLEQDAKQQRNLAKTNKYEREAYKMACKVRNDAEQCRANSVAELNAFQRRLRELISDVDTAAQRNFTDTTTGPAIIRDSVGAGLVEIVKGLHSASHGLMKLISYQSDASAILINVMKDHDARNKEVMAAPVLRQSFGYTESFVDEPEELDENGKEVPRDKRTPKTKPRK